MKNPLVSVVIPIYNVAQYLPEAVESVLQQSIGFREHIELILVNDGSTDGSGALCEKYREQYPENVIYIDKENGGVSSARNCGMERASGTYLTFLDADDKWELTAFESILRFFNENEGKISVVGCRMQRFDAATNMHRLASIYDDGSRVVDIQDPEDCYYIHMHGGPTFFIREDVKELRFPEDMKLNEDNIFVESAVLKTGTLGLCADALYYYRRRAELTSALQTKKNDLSYYTELPQKYYGRMIALSEEQYGSVIPYVQSCIAYDIGWRLTDVLSEEELSGEERARYFDELSTYLQKVEDSVILRSVFHRRLSIKSAILTVKYRHDFYEDLAIEKCAVTYRGHSITSIKENKGLFFIDRLYSDKNAMIFEGRFAAWLEPSFPDGKLLAEVNGEEFEISRQPSDFTVDRNVFGPRERYRTFRFAHHNGKDASVKFFFSTGNYEYPLAINYNPLFPSCDVYECQLAPLDKKHYFKAGRYGIEIFFVKKAELSAVLEEKEQAIKEEYPKAFALRQLPSTSEKPVWLLFGSGERKEQFEALAKTNRKIELHSFSELPQDYKSLYLKADKIIVFEAKNSKSAIVPLGAQQKLLNDKLHFKLFGLLDENDTGNIKRYPCRTEVYQIHDNSAEEIRKAYHAICLIK